jgi:peptidoglycan/xylan/chitin deacetylase (PgdA/CDA1 family)
MIMKHKLKLLARWLVSRALHLTGLRALFRGSRSGVPVLMFHNVGHPSATDYLPGHMKISEARFERLLKFLRRAGYSTMTLGQMAAELSEGRVPENTVVLTFDDGYRDNHDLLLPLLQKYEATATVFVQTGPMAGRLNWLHHYFWVLDKEGPKRLGELLGERLDKQHLREELCGLTSEPVAAEYQLKRLLKYEVAAEDRDRILAAVFTELGGDDASLAKAVYLGPDECRVLDQAGVEIGAHTVNHLILSSLDETKQRKEIEGSLRALETWLGHEVTSFAYPYGRTWDYDQHTQEILTELGFRCAITAMHGLNDGQTPPFELKRIAMCDETSLAEVLCEVDGAFDWFRRQGVELAV